jgi:hypothetical protein
MVSVYTVFHCFCVGVAVDLQLRAMVERGRGFAFWWFHLKGFPCFFPAFNAMSAEFAVKTRFYVDSLFVEASGPAHLSIHRR